MIGTTDFHIATQRRAEVLFAEEQDLMRRGEAQINKIESLMQGEREHWFRTSKVPLRDRDGVIIGLAGVTRDITEERRIERELRDNRNMLSHAMSGMSDGFAMYDPQGKLVYANPQYSNLFPLSGVVRVAGYNIRDILRKAIETQERRNFPIAVDEQWIETAARDLHRDKDEEIDLYDGRWLSLRTRMTADGMALVVVSDVTAMKQAEHSLRAVADRMKSLAETDGLTGIVNRRAFDEALALALARSVRERTPLSLLMIDVDRFKAYNDTYGHLAGDECLKAVTDCLRKAARRDTDIVARFGGEEFVVLMPEADEADACRVAGKFRDALHALNLPHTGSEFTRVTASVGVAVKQSRGRAITPSEFMQHADEALYDAKRGGRDRVSIWESASNARAVNG
jgi:diguanylate cyclase (GGDEF)-like protein